MSLNLKEILWELKLLFVCGRWENFQVSIAWMKFSLQLSIMEWLKRALKLNCEENSENVQGSTLWRERYGGLESNKHGAIRHNYELCWTPTSSKINTDKKLHHKWWILCYFEEDLSARIVSQAICENLFQTVFLTLFYYNCSLISHCTIVKKTYCPRTFILSCLCLPS